jgi:8-oxo-dGTP pyrophosphatase MutT (NUDIX family)
MIQDKPVDDLTEEEIAQFLEKHNRENLNTSPIPDVRYTSIYKPPAARPSAVLVPLLRIHHKWHVLLTRRNAHLAEHSGQVAFPGGRADPHDKDLLQTALREAQEEIGLDPARVRILGRLPDFVTITGYQITPFVSVIPWPYPYKPEQDEVSRVFTIPLEWLADTSHYEERIREVPPSIGGNGSAIFFNPYDGEILWGASARIMLAFLQILGSVP